MSEKFIIVVECDIGCINAGEPERSQLAQRIRDELAKPDPVLILPPGRRLLILPLASTDAAPPVWKTTLFSEPPAPTREQIEAKARAEHAAKEDAAAIAGLPRGKKKSATIAPTPEADNRHA